MYMAFVTTGTYSRDAEHFSKDFQTLHCDTHLKHFFNCFYDWSIFEIKGEFAVTEESFIFVFDHCYLSINCVCL